MAAESVSASEFQELAVKYEALEKQANNLLAAMSRGRAIRNILLLALLVLVGALTYTIYQMGSRLKSPKFMAELTDGAKARMEKSGATVQKHLATLYEKSNPILTKAFQDRAQKDQPRYIAAAEKEWPVFQKDLQAKFQENLLGQYKKAIEAGRPELEQICPELKSDPTKFKKLEDGLISATERAVDKTWVQKVHPQFEKLDVSWRTYPAAPKAAEGEPSVVMQIAGHGMELLAIAFAKGDGLAALMDMPDNKAPGKNGGAGKAPTKTGSDSKKGG